MVRNISAMSYGIRLVCRPALLYQYYHEGHAMKNSLEYLSAAIDKPYLISNGFRRGQPYLLRMPKLLEYYVYVWASLSLSNQVSLDKLRRQNLPGRF